MDLVEFLDGLKGRTTKDLTEADTRAEFIDPLLSLLGWPAGAIKREPYAGWRHAKGFVDYLLLLADRPSYVIEAKKTGRSFSLPGALARQKTTTYRKLIATGNADLIEAVEQCLKYAQHTGAPYACATNGLDWIFFKPSHPHRALPDARVVLFCGTNSILKRLDEFEGLLSPAGVESGSSEKALLGRDIQVPSFAKCLRDAYPYRTELTIEEADYSRTLDQILSHYLTDLSDPSDFDRCYVPSHQNGRASDSLAALVRHQSRSVSERPSRKSADFGNEVIGQHPLPNIVSGRTVILHGPVGIGKTSFLRKCETDLAREGRLNQTVWARIDLLPFSDRPFDLKNAKDMLILLCSTIQERVSAATDRLSGKYDPDTWDHLRDIYNAEVRRFQKGRYPGASDDDHAYLQAARDYVWGLREKDPQDHLVRVIHWLTNNCRLPVVVILDNSDQLGLEFQEFLYKLGETLRGRTSAVTVLVLRTEALLSHHIREHALASTREQFQIEKTPLFKVLERRFEAMEEAAKQVANHQPGEHRVALERLLALIETLGRETERGSDTYRILDSLGDGNIRLCLRGVAAIFRASPKLMDSLVATQYEGRRIRIYTSRILRSLMKEDLQNPTADRLVPNVFLVESEVLVPYSLGIRMLQQVRSKTSVGDYPAGQLLNDFSVAGVDRTVAARVMQRLRRNRLLRVAHMLPSINDTDTVSVTQYGTAMLDIVLLSSDYFDQMAFETHVYDRGTYDDLRSIWNSDHMKFHKKFEALGRLFVDMILDDDRALRRSLDLSHLEPVIGSELSLGGSSA